MDIWALTEPIAEELGLEVLDIELKGAPAGRVLRIYLDSREPGRGVGVADCEAVSRRLGDVLDAHEAVAGRYMLEVSSPGVNRPLRKAGHYDRAVGERVRLRLRDAAAAGGYKTLVGKLEGVEDGTLRVAVEGGAVETVSLGSIQKANVEFLFDEASKTGKTGTSRKKRTRRKRH